VCPECERDIIAVDGEEVCESCGLVIDETKVDHGPDWRSFSDSTTDPSRASPIDPGRHDNGMGADGYTPGDLSDIDARRRAILSDRSESATARRIRGATGEIKRLGSALDIPGSVVEQACVLFKKFHSERDDCKGHNLDHLSAAALYVASREAKLGVVTAAFVEQIEMATDVDSEFTQSDLFGEMRVIVNTLDIQLSPRTPDVFIPRIVSKLNGSAQADTIARQIAADLRESEVTTGGNPAGVAAGAVYEAFTVSGVDEDTTQKAVAEAAGVAIPTVRSHWKTITENGLGDDPRGV
jgi:transcription initiation factor TFIIB